MTSQLFKEKYPKDKFFAFLDKYCDKTDKYYTVSKVAYKKAKLEGAVRQICKHHLIAYTSNIKYSKSKYEIIYFIYFEP